MGSTTNRYLAYPNTVAGKSLVSSATAWTFGSYVELVPVNTITVDFYIVGFVWLTFPTAAVDVTVETLFEVATGLAASEVLAVQFPSTWRIDSAAGHMPLPQIILPEPKLIAANTRLSARVANTGTVAFTYAGFKLLYQRA